MSAELSAVLGFGLAAAASGLATPIAIAVARRTRFFDRPREYRKHRAPTPLLGGAAVLVGFLVAAVAIGGATGSLLPLLGCAVGLWVLGTLDDKVAVAPKWRLLAETLAAAALVVGGLGWQLSGGDGLELALTVVWVVGLVNAFNLMDNLDGACGAVGCVSAAGIGVLAAVHGMAPLAGMAFALSGACAGFLPLNLAGPARVFLGDGGSMPIGFLVAGLAMATGRKLHVGDASVLVGALLAGVVILDTALVSASRIRRRVTLSTGGRDHLTHRLLQVLGSPRRVAGTLAAVQATLCALAILGDRLGTPGLASIAVAAVALGVAAIALLDSHRWRPIGISASVKEPMRVADPPPDAPARLGQVVERV